jgi:hydroxymethylbilane synthase
VTEIRLGTRGSQLALWQARAVAAHIEAAGGPLCRLVEIRTSGDRLQEAPLSEVGGKRLFVKEIEDALLKGEIDAAVHSCKDMPSELPDGLVIGGVLGREDPLDAIVLPKEAAQDRATDDAGDPARSFLERLESLGPRPTIGTGSVRRIAQLTPLMPGATFTPIRGNLDTRLRKLDSGEYDALILAAAGLKRLGFASRISLTIPAVACVPAPGQGIVAVEIRAGDEKLAALTARINDDMAAAAMRAERALVRALGGGCQTPIGALAARAGGGLELLAIVVALDGRREVLASGRGAPEEAAELGDRVARQLIDGGADEILAEARHTEAAVRGIQP